MDAYMIRVGIGSRQMWLQSGDTGLGEVVSFTPNKELGSTLARKDIELFWCNLTVRNLLIAMDYEILPIGSSPQIRLA